MKSYAEVLYMIKNAAEEPLTQASARQWAVGGRRALKPGEMRINGKIVQRPVRQPLTKPRPAVYPSTRYTKQPATTATQAPAAANYTGIPHSEWNQGFKFTPQEINEYFKGDPQKIAEFNRQQQAHRNALNDINTYQRSRQRQTARNGFIQGAEDLMLGAGRGIRAMGVGNVNYGNPVQNSQYQLGKFPVRRSVFGGMRNARQRARQFANNPRWRNR